MTEPWTNETTNRVYVKGAGKTALIKCFKLVFAWRVFLLLFFNILIYV